MLGVGEESLTPAWYMMNYSFDIWVTFSHYHIMVHIPCEANKVPEDAAVSASVPSPPTTCCFTDKDAANFS